MNGLLVGKTDNKGASLVLVIVALLFVGIISVLILTLTVGNANTVDTVSKSSENFYSTEEFVDDLKLYLQKLANTAATKAYAAQLSSMTITGQIEDEDADFQRKYRKYLKDELANVWADLTSADNVRNITFGQYDSSSGIIFSIDGSLDDVYDEATGTIKGIQVYYKDGKNDNSTKIYTDLVFDARKPELNARNPEATFDYNVDKFIIISNKNVLFKNAKSDITGSVYAKNDIDFLLDAKTKLTSQYVIAGDNINVDGNELEFSGFGDALRDVKKKEYVLKVTSNENIWTTNLNIKKAMSISNAKIYLKDDLSLDENGASFVVKDNANSSIIAYSSDTTAAGNVTTHQNSGAIIINGKAVTLDLAKLKTLILAGTAYTEVPKIAGTNTENSYFVQGESITYRTLQSMYLVNGSDLFYETSSGEKVTIGRNPMTEEEFYIWSKDSRATVTAKNAYSYNIVNKPEHVNSSTPFVYKDVQYVSGSDKPVYYYVYWNFESVQAAVDYFNSLYSSDSATAKNKMTLFGGGKIILPTSTNVKTKGNLISYDTTKAEPMGFKAADFKDSEGNAIDCSSYSTTFNSLKSTLSETSGGSGDLFTSALFGNRLNKINSYSMKVERLIGPDETFTVEDETYSDGQCVASVTKSGDTLTPNLDSTDYTYYLVTGNNIVIDSGDDRFAEISNWDNAKFIVVSSGRVIFSKNSGKKSFNGIVFAVGGEAFSADETEDLDYDASYNGGVFVNGDWKLNCLGNYTWNVTSDDNSETHYLSEFEAVLKVVTDDSDSDDPNTVLRNLFGVRSGSYDESTGRISGDIANVNSYNWTKEE